MSDFNLNKFRTEFLQSDGWQVSDCYKPYDDKFLRRDAQDAYEGAKWAWNEQQEEILRLQALIINMSVAISESYSTQDVLQKRIDKSLVKIKNAMSLKGNSVAMSTVRRISSEFYETLKGNNND